MFDRIVHFLSKNSKEEEKDFENILRKKIGINNEELSKEEEKDFENILDDDRADYPSLYILESRLTGPYLGGYPVELDGLIDTSITEKCQIENCRNPVNNSCVIDTAEHDPISRGGKEAYHVCEDHNADDIMNDKVYNICKKCTESYNPGKMFSEHVLNDLDFCPSCFSSLCDMNSFDEMLMELNHYIGTDPSVRNEKFAKIREWKEKAENNFKDN